jgi:serine/threonine-protein kinase
MKHALVALVLVAALAEAPAALAEDAAAAAAAEALFLEGRALLDAGELEPACQRLRESQALDPGIGTLMLLGHCYELLGKTASAWATFRAVDSLASAAKQTERAQIARLRAVALDPVLVRLRIDLPPGADTTTWVVLRDGVLVPVSAAGVAVPVDPGDHRVEVRVPSRKPWSAVVSAAAGAGVVPLEVPDLTPARAAVEPSPPRGASRRAVPRSTAPNPEAASERASGTHAVAFVAAGAGVLAAGVGTAYGLWARSTYEGSQRECRTERFCSARGLSLRESAERKALLSTVAFASGGVLLGSAAVLWLVGRDSREVALGAAVGSEGFVLGAGGEF